MTHLSDLRSKQQRSHEGRITDGSALMLAIWVPFGTSKARHASIFALSPDNEIRTIESGMQYRMKVSDKSNVFLPFAKGSRRQQIIAMVLFPESANGRACPVRCAAGGTERPCEVAKRGTRCGTCAGHAECERFMEHSARTHIREGSADNG